MELIKFLLKFSRRTVVLAIIAGVLSGTSSALLIALVHRTLSHYASSSLSLVLAFVGLCLLLPVARLASTILMTKLSQTAIFELRMRLCRQIVAAPLRQQEKVGSHRIMATLTDDVSVITSTLSNIPVLCMQTAVVVGTLVYLAWLSWVVFLAVLIFMTLGIFSFRVAVSRAMAYMMRAREHSDELFKHFRAINDGAKELKLHRKRRRAFIDKILLNTAETLKRQNVTANTVMAFAGSWYQVLFFTLIGMLLFVLPFFQQVSGTLVTGYILAIFFMRIPFEDLTGIIPNFARASISLKRVEGLGLSLKDSIAEGEAPELIAAGAEWDKLELKNVTHTYYSESHNAAFTLGPIDLTFRSGELTFLVGGNGSGKTTLAKLITGLYVPEDGEIRFDGEPINDQNRDLYRQHFSVVFSDFFLFENLLGLNSNKLEADANKYLSQLQLSHKVQVKDGALSTIDLSQGQRKRLALLTAFLEDRPFYVFDEWAADQDPLFRDVFYLQILPELKARGKTVLVISHDDRYYYLGDRLIKLDYGQIERDADLPAHTSTPNPMLPTITKLSLVNSK